MSHRKPPKKVIAIVLFLALLLTGYEVFMKNPNDAGIYFGEIEGETYDISSTAAGIIKSISVKEGDVITANTIVAEIDNEESQLRLEKSEKSLDITTTQLEKSESPARQEEINIQINQIEQLKTQKTSTTQTLEKTKKLLTQNKLSLETQKLTRDLKLHDYNNAKDLYAVGSLSEDALLTAELTYKTADNAYRSAQTQNETFQNDITSLNAQIKSIALQIASATEKLNMLKTGADSRDQNIAKLGQEASTLDVALTKAQSDKYKIKSYNAGILETIHYNEGEFVNIGAPLMTLTDDKKATLKIYIHEKDLPKLKIGSTLNITSSNDKVKADAPSLVGHVTNISSKAIFTPMNIVTVKDREKLVYPVTIEITPTDTFKAGMLVKVDLGE